MKLYGIPVSNYYNIAKLALLEKGIEFEEVNTPPSKEPTFLAHSPMGKIPYLQHGDIFLCESQAILFYLELYQPTPRLFPLDPVGGARAQQIHQFIDLYIDATARKLLGAAFFGKETTAEEIARVGHELKNNIDALSRVVSFDPFIAGDFSHADLAAFMTFDFAQAVMQRLKGPDPLTQLPGVGAYLQMISKRPSCQRVLEDKEKAMAKIFT